ncbi:MAG: phosphoadenylyl-sulfate reductase [Chlorobium sp.]|jgi:phosphoadenosine phosphosulfate reductase|nr:phosphoadenylyl-sulfate reductase [Chlorobium sp.]
MSRGAVEKLSLELSGKTPQEILRRTVDFFGSSKIALASSFGAEDQVIIDILHKEALPVPVFTLDTGRLPQETYDVLDATRKRYGIEVQVLFPETSAVEQMVTLHGPNLFYDSVELRRECCRVRKVQPLAKKLSTLTAWVCGLRREQSVTRTAVAPVEWDAAFGLYKINPLAEVSEAWVWEYIKEHSVPVNSLHDQGYPSIGCAPCSRAVNPGEDLRAGRWWWEMPEHRECGLHREKQ